MKKLKFLLEGFWSALTENKLLAVFLLLSVIFSVVATGGVLRLADALDDSVSYDADGIPLTIIFLKEIFGNLRKI